MKINLKSINYGLVSLISLFIFLVWSGIDLYIASKKIADPNIKQALGNIICMFVAYVSIQNIDWKK